MYAYLKSVIITFFYNTKNLCYMCLS